MNKNNDKSGKKAMTDKIRRISRIRTFQENIGFILKCFFLKILIAWTFMKVFLHLDLASQPLSSLR